ncbi:NAD(P)/FAD-dependent oxidoreductase [Bacillus pinisoli]|uniref:NAD(P)/FAD-dependent oxidoreductase n=1 Tax=Bacillus pinisoli TaxID=2901866 RepID=UPI001FF6C883|nr:NAD(P)/FAD-dependent oxidoreductase [Bacillus pinisoli]
MKSFTCIIVGGGIAGLQAAIMLGRYGHQVAVFDKGEGRSTLCKCYHNVLGYPDGIEGEHLRRLGKEHAEKYGVHFIKAEVTHAQKTKRGFDLQTITNDRFKCQYLLVATGIKDRLPLSIPNLKECLGISIYICPDCDGYEVKNKKTIVIGSGESGANMALTLTYFTKEVTFVNHEKAEIVEAKQQELKDKGIEIINESVEKVNLNATSAFSGVTLSSGRVLHGERGFIAFGGSIIQTDLLKQLGVERLENHHIAADPRSKETNIRNVWVAGDIVAHSEQLTIAMGEGAQAAIWMHKRILGQ